MIETCGIRASSYSAAEVLHGPSRFLRAGFPVLALTSGASNGMDQAATQLRAQGARVVALASNVDSGHPLVDPLLHVIPLYGVIERVS